LGNYYESLVNESPYTREMNMIDENYLNLFLESVKDIPMGAVDPSLSFGLQFIKNKFLRGISLRLANSLGSSRVLPLIESEKTYVQIPIRLANKLGNAVNPTFVPSIPSLADRIANLQYDDDSESHIIVNDKRSEFMRKLILLCPTKCYSLEGYDVVLQHEGCVECGTCSIGTIWKHPKGEKGIRYRYG